MRETIIKTCDMLKARANATADLMLEGMAYTLAIMNQVGYDELDSRVWNREEFNYWTTGRKD